MHFGPPDDLESYVQETSRAGRDGLPSLALPLTKKRSSKYVSKSMIKYYTCTSECRRDLLFSFMKGYTKPSFQKKCLCCDSCFSKCECNTCCLDKSFIIIIMKVTYTYFVTFVINVQLLPFC